MKITQKIQLTHKRTSGKKFCLSIFVIYAALWTILESIAFFFPELQVSKNNWPRYIVLLIITLILTLYKEFPKDEIELNLDNTGQKIIIKFGDLFESKGFRVIPISKFIYETEVFQHSLQNLLIKKFTDDYQGVHQGFKKYEDAIIKATKSIPFQEKTRFSPLQEKYYDLGTTILLEKDGGKYLLFAITETESTKFVPPSNWKNCDINKMTIALQKLWNYCSIHIKDQVISMPLIGGGIVGMQLSPMQLLEFNLIIIADFVKQNKKKITTNEIQIVLYPPYYDNIDLKAIEAVWTNYLNTK